MPTRLRYSYGNNSEPHDVWHEVVFADDIRPGDVDTIWKALLPWQGPFARRGVGFFIPYQVGLPDLQPQLSQHWDINDHVWHKLARIDITPTSRPVTIELTFAELVERFANVTWDAVGTMERILF